MQVRRFLNHLCDLASPFLVRTAGISGQCLIFQPQPQLIVDTWVRKLRSCGEDSGALRASEGDLVRRPMIPPPSLLGLVLTLTGSTISENITADDVELPQRHRRLAFPALVVLPLRRRESLSSRPWRARTRCAVIRDGARAAWFGFARGQSARVLQRDEPV